MRNEEDRERRVKKVKFNSLFEDDTTTKNIKLDNSFNIPKDIIVKKRPCKTRNVIKESPVIQNTEVLMNIHSNDPLTLYDFYMMLNKIRITEDIFIIVIRRCKDVIFREINNKLPTGNLFYPGDDTCIKNKTVSNINIFTKIMLLLTNKCYNKDIISREISDMDIISLFNLLKSEDDRERLNICNILINIFDTFQYKIRNILENEMILFYEGERTHVGIEEMLEILQVIIRNTRDDTFYYQIILRFLNIKNLEYYKLIEDIIYKYCSDDLKISTFTLKFLYKIFTEIDYINKPVIVRLYFLIYVRWSRRIPFTQIIRETCFIINYGLSSEHHILIEEVLKIIESRIMKNIFKEHITDILPRIFENLYITSKRFWSSKGKLNIYKYISLLLSINHECFEKCLVKYNKKKFYQKCTSQDTVLDILGKCLENSDIEYKTQDNKFKRRNSTEYDGKTK